MPAAAKSMPVSIGSYAGHADAFANTSRSWTRSPPKRRRSGEVLTPDARVAEALRAANARCKSRPCRCMADEIGRIGFASCWPEKSPILRPLTSTTSAAPTRRSSPLRSLDRADSSRHSRRFAAHPRARAAGRECRALGGARIRCAVRRRMLQRASLWLLTANRMLTSSRIRHCSLCPTNGRSKTWSSQREHQRRGFGTNIGSRIAGPSPRPVVPPRCYWRSGSRTCRPQTL